MEKAEHIPLTTFKNEKEEYYLKTNMAKKKTFLMTPAS